MPLSGAQQPPCLRRVRVTVTCCSETNKGLTLSRRVIQLSYVITAGKCQSFLSIPGRKPVLLKQEPVFTVTGSAEKVSATKQPLYLSLAGSFVT
jgi:hypothetical protein